jgi:hypothetical protein
MIPHSGIMIFNIINEFFRKKFCFLLPRYLKQAYFNNKKFLFLCLTIILNPIIFLNITLFDNRLLVLDN